MCSNLVLILKKQDMDTLLVALVISLLQLLQVESEAAILVKFTT
jgi:hypothetical protein